ncbi:M12 family metallo-peptidase [Flavobacterium crassostreae]|uniref:PKD domain-containing protein n=1 Tax=Flavobacterium crassostreae TaxID=1763534 RepID=A0A1B9E2D6_9FLAO|nr:M12 family metallo-peptidase [Flavobacterium crassostreae]OCB76086.1 hypothetical protein LPBF_07185 [Flavobacterium crassostreae]
MKKILIICSFLSVFNAFSQGKIAEKVLKNHQAQKGISAYQIFDYSKNVTSKSSAEAQIGATYLTLSDASFQELYTQSKPNIELTVPYNGKNLILQLYKETIFADGFTQIIATSKTASTKTSGVFYKGIIKGDLTSVVSINIFDDQINGLISSKEHGFGNLVLGKSTGLQNKSNYVVYSDANLNQPIAAPCQTPGNSKPLPLSALQKIDRSAATKCVSVYVEVDYDIYKQNGNNVTQTTNWALSVFNNSQTLYENDGISIRLQAIKIWDTSDPYQGTSSVQNVQSFRSYNTSFVGDVALLIANDPGGLGGVALGIGTMCTPNSYAYADVDVNYNQFPTYSWTVGVVAHELGHVLGSPHTHACVWNGNNTAIDNCGPVGFPGYGGDECLTNPPTLPYQEKGTIMSYCHGVSSVGISFANGFGAQPRTAIQNAVNRSNCLSSSCVTTPVSPTAAFSADATAICLGKSVKFKDTSTGSPTSWAWTFQGGTPATATTQNPVVTYSNSGTYTVTLKVTNAQGTNTKQSIGYINVGQTSSVMPNENFGGVFPPQNWSISNPDNGLTWEKRSDVGNGDKACMIMNNADNPTIGEQDIIRLPYYNFTSLKSGKLFFDIAYTQFDASSADVLKVQVSENCGTNWTDVYSKTHTQLETVVVPTADSNAWIPTKASDWRKETIDLSDYDGKESVSIRFLNTSGYGTRIWIDNLLIENGSILGTHSLNYSSEVSLYPSPSTGIFNLNFPELGKDYQVKIYNLAGQQIFATSFTEISVSEHKINLQAQPKGLYLVTVQSNQKESVLKVLIQ